MLIGYVSDEQYSALADVLFEFIDESGNSFETRSRASGAVYLEKPLKSVTGKYKVVLQKQGFGSKICSLSLPLESPHQFRLLSDSLIGYAWPKQVCSGQSSEFRVHSVEPYKLELFRYGITPEFISSHGWHDEHAPRAVMQITPDGDYTQTGVLWNKTGYANSVHSQSIKAPLKSGLYYFRVSTATGKQFSFPWIVASAKPVAKLAVLASNLNWNAYNSFGGRSNYIHADGLPPTPTINSRTELKRYSDDGFFTWSSANYPPLSFDRPEPFNHIPFDEKITDPIEGRQACHLAPAEWRLLGWLEQENFNYDYFAESQLHDSALDLSHYKVLVTAVHPEYWTRTMFDKVKLWVFQGKGRLIYLGGNGLNCEVEINSDGAMVCHNCKLTGLDTKGLGGFESRFAIRQESEASLLGVVFTPTGAMTGAPYRVQDGSHWVFENTGLHSGDIFGEKSLHRRCPGGASGHETDKISPCSPDGILLLAKGMNPDDGGAEMVIFDTPSGGKVFSVGSISYVASLPVDEQISKITANVLRKFLQ